MKLQILASLLIAPLLRAAPVSLQNAGASFSQTGFSAAATTDGLLSLSNGWAVSPQISATNRIWWSTPALGSSTQARCVDFTLSFRGTSIGTPYNIRRFLIAYTTDAVPSNTATWLPLSPGFVSTSAPASGTLSADLATGKISLAGLGVQNFDYRVSAELPANAAITGLSLQVFPADTFVGTNSSGNFILTEFAADLRAAPVIALTSAGSTFAQSGYAASKTIDAVVATNNGWAVSGGSTVAQRIWWNTASVPASTAPRRFQFTLNFRGTTGSFQKFNIRRFLLAATSSTTVSNTSAWTVLNPVAASVSGAATGGLSINPATGEVSLTGGDGEVSMNYHVTADAPAGAALTGFSLQAVPVSGKLGTDIAGNFVLGEVSITGTPAYITVPESVTISEDDPLFGLKLVSPASPGGGFVVGATTTGTAAYPADYARSFGTTGSISFAATETTAPFTLSPVNDALNESPETIVITWTPSACYTLSAPTTTITIGDTDGSGYDDYMAGHGLNATSAVPSADPNEDGISNIEAYVFRLNPAGPFPDAWHARRPYFTTRGSGTVFPALTWQVPAPFPTDVAFTLQESATLQSWSNAASRSGYGSGSAWTGTTAASAEDAGSPRTVTIRGTQSISARPKAFLRLKLDKVSTGTN